MVTSVLSITPGDASGDIHRLDMNCTLSAPAVNRPLPATYVARLGTDPATLRGAQALRFAVFNLELQEGLPSAYQPVEIIVKKRDNCIA